MAYTTLIDTHTLARHLSDPAWIIFDCRHDLARPQWGAEEFARAHIPQARFAHCDRQLSGPRTSASGRHPLPDAQSFVEFLAASGVSTSSQIVAYDAQGGMFAARLWWLARWVGHSAVAVLDGGWDQWLAERHPVSSAPPHAVRAPLEGNPRPHWVDADFVHSRSSNFVLIDARAPDRFRGENETLDPVAGHIPGARNRFFRENLATDGKFKNPTVLADEFNRILDGKRTNEVIHSCGSGVSACHNVLAMEVAGLTGSLLYAGSWSEWCANPARPIATGPG